MLVPLFLVLRICNMEFLMDICRLTDDFVRDYPAAEYPELMYKIGRPYNCLLIDVHLDDYFIFVPYRSNIRHNNAFKFKGTERAKKHNSGLDYTKIILIKKYEYGTDRNIVIDQDEYNETRRNIQKIATKVLEYIDTYVNHCNGTKVLHPRKFERKYKYSTLRYFHDLLKLE